MLHSLGTPMVMCNSGPVYNWHFYNNAYTCMQRVLLVHDEGTSCPSLLYSYNECYVLLFQLILGCQFIIVQVHGHNGIGRSDMYYIIGTIS